MRPKTGRSVAGAAASLFEDHQFEILRSSRTKTLVRLQLVCKSWHSYISDHNLLQPLGFFYNPLSFSASPHPSSDDDEVPSESHPVFNRCLNRKPKFDEKLGFLPNQFCDFNLVDCLNGILLFNQTGDRFLVCNPITEKFAVVPYSSPVNRLFPSSYLAFDFAPNRNCFFKIVSLLNGQINIYSSHNGQWDEPVQLLQDPSWDLGLPDKKVQAAFSKGFLYVPGCSHVLRIGVSNGNQKIIALPAGSTSAKARERPEVKTVDRLLGILTDRVCYAEIEDLLLRIWVLEEKSRKWEMRLKTKIHHKKLKSRVQILAFHPYLPTVYFHTGLRVVAFDLKAKNLEMVSVLGIDKIKVKEAIAFPFFPSCHNDGL